MAAKGCQQVSRKPHLATRWSALSCPVSSDGRAALTVSSASQPARQRSGSQATQRSRSGSVLCRVTEGALLGALCISEATQRREPFVPSPEAPLNRSTAVLCWPCHALWASIRHKVHQMHLRHAFASLWLTWAVSRPRAVVNSCMQLSAGLHMSVRSSTSWR